MIRRNRRDDALLAYQLALALAAPLYGWDEVTFVAHLGAGGGQVGRAGLRSRP